MNSLAGLVDRFFGGKQDGNLIFQPNRLSEFGRTNRRVDDVAQLIAAHQSRGKSELRLCRSPAVGMTREQDLGLLVASQQFNLYGTVAGDHLVFRVGDDYAHCGRTTRQIGLLAENVNHRAEQYLRNRFRALELCDAGIRVFKTIVHAVPNQFVDSELLRDSYLLSPISLALRNLGVALRASDHLVFWIQNLYYHLAGAGMRGIVRED